MKQWKEKCRIPVRIAHGENAFKLSWHITCRVRYQDLYGKGMSAIQQCGTLTIKYSFCTCSFWQLKKRGITGQKELGIRNNDLIADDTRYLWQGGAHNDSESLLYSCMPLSTPYLHGFGSGGSKNKII